MSLLECVIVAQTSGSQTQAGNPPVAWYLVIALVAAVMGLVVLIFIRTSTRRSSRR
jgi:capsular polysaccharide biosynthesis protein